MPIAWALTLPVALAACGSKPASDARAVAKVPERVDTPADRWLAVLPGGADALLEIDIARMRENTTVGPLVRAFTGESGLDIGFDVLRDADAIVVASYAIGEPEAGQITIVRGPRAAEITGAKKLDDRTVALASAALFARLDAVGRGQDRSLRDDVELLRVRARAMPEEADGASIRVAAVLDFDARISLAGQLDIDPVPRTLSVWGDVADDLAVVALLGGDDAEQAKKLGEAVSRLRDRVARSKPLARLVIGYVLRGMQITVAKKAVRVILVVGPDRLERIVTRLMGKLS